MFKLNPYNTSNKILKEVDQLWKAILLTKM